MLAWIVSVILTLLAALLISNSPLLLNHSFYLLLALMAVMWIPGIVALLFAKRAGLFLPIFKFNRVAFLAVLVALLIGAGSILFSFSLGHYWGFEYLRAQLGDQLDLFNPPWLASLFIYTILTLYAAVVGLTVNAFAALGEEILWRGYLWERWKQRGLGLYVLGTGICWGLWHWPLILWIGFMYPQDRLIGLGAMVLLCLLLTPLHLYFRLRGRSIYTAAVFHGTLNAAAPTALFVFREANPLLIGIAGAAGMAFLAIINLLFWKRLKQLAEHSYAG